MLRQAGVLGPWGPLALQPPPLFAAGLRHHRTVRGHRAVVYCTACDSKGRYLITGADDRLVKVREN